MHPFVQIDLPPYTDYASLEQKLTIAVEYVSIVARFLRVLMLLHLQGDRRIWSGVEHIPSTLTPFTPSKFLPLIMFGHSSFPLTSPALASSACLVSRQCAVTPCSRCLDFFHQFSARLGYNSISCGLLLMCNQSLSYESLLGFPTLLSEGVGRVFPLKASPRPCKSLTLPPCVRISR